MEPWKRQDYHISRDIFKEKQRWKARAKDKAIMATKVLHWLVKQRMFSKLT